MTVMHRTKEFRPVWTQHHISWLVFHLLAALLHRIVSVAGGQASGQMAWGWRGAARCGSPREGGARGRGVGVKTGARQDLVAELPVRCGSRRESVNPCRLSAGYGPGIAITLRRCPVRVSQCSIPPSAVPKTIEVPSGPRIRLLVGRAAGKERCCPLCGFHSRSILPKPAYTTHPVAETVNVSTYSDWGAEIATSCFVVRSQTYTLPSWDPISIVPRAPSKAIERNV